MKLYLDAYVFTYLFEVFFYYKRIHFLIEKVWLTSLVKIVRVYFLKFLKLQVKNLNISNLELIIVLV